MRPNARTRAKAAIRTAEERPKAASLPAQTPPTNRTIKAPRKAPEKAPKKDRKVLGKAPGKAPRINNKAGSKAAANPMPAASPSRGKRAMPAMASRPAARRNAGGVVAKSVATSILRANHAMAANLDLRATSRGNRPMTSSPPVANPTADPMAIPMANRTRARMTPVNIPVKHPTGRQPIQASRRRRGMNSRQERPLIKARARAAPRPRPSKEQAGLFKIEDKPTEGNSGNEADRKTGNADKPNDGDDKG